MAELRLGNYRFPLNPRRPLLMGIVNVGRDSVADPLDLNTPAARLAQARRQVEAGAQIVDVGAISGRTDTPQLGEEEERALLVEVVAPLAAEGVCVSVETWRPAVAEAALAAGASLINDVSGLAEPTLALLCARYGAGLVVMHTAARPKERRFPHYHDLVGEVKRFLARRAAAALKAGLARESILIDPGLDFAKRPEQSVALMRALAAIRQLDFPLLLGISRKYFIGLLTGRPPHERLAGTLGALAWGLQAGAEVVRVHDVAAAADFLHVYRTVAGEETPRWRGDPEDERLMWLPPKA